MLHLSHPGCLRIFQKRVYKELVEAERYEFKSEGDGIILTGRCGKGGVCNRGEEITKPEKYHVFLNSSRPGTPTVHLEPDSARGTQHPADAPRYDNGKQL